MKKKILGAREALEGGVRRVVLADARAEAPLTRALAGRGTVLGAVFDARGAGAGAAASPAGEPAALRSGDVHAPQTAGPRSDVERRAEGGEPSGDGDAAGRTREPRGRAAVGRKAGAPRTTEVQP
jgi:hypothetical protein